VTGPPHGISRNKYRRIIAIGTTGTRGRAKYLDAPNCLTPPNLACEQSCCDDWHFYWHFHGVRGGPGAPDWSFRHGSDREKIIPGTRQHLTEPCDGAVTPCGSCEAYHLSAASCQSCMIATPLCADEKRVAIALTAKRQRRSRHRAMSSRSLVCKASLLLNGGCQQVQRRYAATSTGLSQGGSIVKASQQLRLKNKC
jgi:hypothetical protein